MSHDQLQLRPCELRLESQKIDGTEYLKLIDRLCDFYFILLNLEA